MFPWREETRPLPPYPYPIYVLLPLKPRSPAPPPPRKPLLSHSHFNLPPFPSPYPFNLFPAPRPFNLFPVPIPPRLSFNHSSPLHSPFKQQKQEAVPMARRGEPSPSRPPCVLVRGASRCQSTFDSKYGESRCPCKSKRKRKAATGGAEMGLLIKKAYRRFYHIFHAESVPIVAIFNDGACTKCAYRG